MPGFLLDFCRPVSSRVSSAVSLSSVLQRCLSDCCGRYLGSYCFPHTLSATNKKTRTLSADSCPAPSAVAPWSAFSVGCLLGSPSLLWWSVFSPLCVSAFFNCFFTFWSIFRDFYIGDQVTLCCFVFWLLFCLFSFLTFLIFCIVFFLSANVKEEINGHNTLGQQTIVK